jgi:excisionase family DNA binding protein
VHVLPHRVKSKKRPGPQGRPAVVPDSSETLTCRQLAELLQISTRVLYRLVRQGTIPGRLPFNPRITRYSRPAVMQWLAAGCPGLDGKEAAHAP